MILRVCVNYHSNLGFINLRTASYLSLSCYRIYLIGGIGGVGVIITPVFPEGEPEAQRS